LEPPQPYDSASKLDALQTLRVVVHPDEGLDNGRAMEHGCDMTEMFRCRVEKDLLDDAHRISKDMGTSTSELVRIFLKALVKSGQLPFTPKVTSEEDEVLGPVNRRREMLEYLHEN
jgi:addiction module RelB/DinJ family antitoxin